jgi:hypothetical protein
MNIGPGAPGRYGILAPRAARVGQAGGSSLNSPVIEVEASPLHERTRGETPPATPRAQIFRPLEQGMRPLEIPAKRGNPRHDNICAENALQHGAGLDERDTVDQHDLRLIEPALLVADQRQQAGRQRRRTEFGPTSFSATRSPSR